MFSAMWPAPPPDVVFARLTGLTPAAAAQCLAANNGDARQALASFVQSRRAIPAAAFFAETRADANAAAIKLCIGQVLSAV